MSTPTTNLGHILKEVRLRNKAKFEHMTVREKEILTLWINGLSSEAIADVLKISKSTVGTHRKNIIRKTQLKSPKDFVLFAIAFDLI